MLPLHVTDIELFAIECCHCHFCTAHMLCVETQELTFALTFMYQYCLSASRSCGQHTHRHRHTQTQTHTHTLTHTHTHTHTHRANVRRCYDLIMCVLVFACLFGCLFFDTYEYGVDQCNESCLSGQLAGHLMWQKL